MTRRLKGDEQVVVVGQGGLKSGTLVKVVDDGRRRTPPSPTRSAPNGRACRERRRLLGDTSCRSVDFAIRRRVTIVMCTVAIALFGFVSLSRLKVNLLPDLSYPTLTVRTELPGAAPLEIENLITRPVEEAVGIIRNVR